MLKKAIVNGRAGRVCIGQSGCGAESRSLPVCSAGRCRTAWRATASWPATATSTTQVDVKDSVSWGFGVGFNATDNVEVGFLFGQQLSTMVLKGTAERELGDLTVNTYHPTSPSTPGAPDALGSPVPHDWLRRHQLRQRGLHPRQRDDRNNPERDPVLDDLGRWA